MQVSHQTFKIKANGLTIHVTLRFLLGTRTNALRYINQFTEIFTEEGRKNVKSRGHTELRYSMDMSKEDE